MSSSGSLIEQIGLKSPLQPTKGDNELDPLDFDCDFVATPKLSLLYSISGLVLPLFGLGLPNIKNNDNVVKYKEILL